MGGGNSNQASGTQSTVGGGSDNEATGFLSTVGGGSANKASGDYSTVPGGFENVASNEYSFAAGVRAKAVTERTFVWNGDDGVDFQSTQPFQFLINANVGIRINNPKSALDVNGSVRATDFINTSSRVFKEDIRPLSRSRALETVESLEPVSFRFKAYKSRELILGFIAEDVPEVIATKDRKAIHPLNIIAALTKVVQDQQERIASLEKRLTNLERER